MRFLPLLAFSLVSPSALAAEAQPSSVSQPSPAPAEDVDGSGDDIVVVATRLRGQVESVQPPIMTLEEEDVAAYGVSTIGELLEAISPQTSSGRGRGGGHPLILLNGQRISSFRQLRNIPPEAIRRMEVLPEEVALRFGAPPDQRVVNFILKENFSAVTLAGEYNIPTRGGFSGSELEGGLVRFDGPRRLSLNLKVEDTSLLTEAERSIFQPVGSFPTVPGDPDPARFRSLVDDSVTYTGDASWSTGLGEEGLEGSLTLDGSWTHSDSLSYSGLDTVSLAGPGSGAPTEVRTLGDPLLRRSRADLFEGGVTLYKPLGGWQLTGTVDSNFTDRRTRIDRQADTSSLIAAAASGELDIGGALPVLPDAGFDTASSKIVTVDSQLTLTGNPVTLPAGEISVTFDAGYDFQQIRSRDTRGSTALTKLSRNSFSAGANVTVPLTSRRRGVLDAIGDVSLNFSGGIAELSDFGTLLDWNAGIIWRPIEKLTLQATYIYNQQAPSLTDLGDPVSSTFNVPIYDFATGDAALVTVLSGGNPFLSAETQRDLKLSGELSLPLFRRSSLLVEYFRNRSSNVTQSFPLLTPEIEAAFPDRFERDAAGQLVSIDRRPVTFSRIGSSRLRWGLDFSGRVSREPPQRESGGRTPFGGGRHGGGRWSFSLYHTYRLSDQVTIAPNIAPFNQLDGFALGAGGVPRHSLEAEGGIFKDGFGARFEVDYYGPAYVRSDTASDLRFGGLLRVDARFFVNLGEKEKLVEQVPFLKGVRVSFNVENLFDARQRVTDESGEVPLAYQAAYRDPRGRFMGIDVRKRF